MQVDVADTVGCGDSFAAAVLMGFTRRHSIPATLALANAVGGATAMGKGAGASAGRSFLSVCGCMSIHQLQLVACCPDISRWAHDL